jgi:hypothetical protein
VALSVAPALLGQLDAAALRRDGGCDDGALVHGASLPALPVAPSVMSSIRRPAQTVIHDVRISTMVPRLEKDSNGRLLVGSFPLETQAGDDSLPEQVVPIGAFNPEVEAFVNWFADWWLRRGRHWQPSVERSSRYLSEPRQVNRQTPHAPTGQDTQYPC